jgi:hypothetical protein
MATRENESYFEGALDLPTLKDLSGARIHRFSLPKILLTSR